MFLRKMKLVQLLRFIAIAPVNVKQDIADAEKQIKSVVQNVTQKKQQNVLIIIKLHKFIKNLGKYIIIKLYIIIFF